MKIVPAISHLFDSIANHFILKRKAVNYRDVQIYGKLVVLGTKGSISIGERTMINSSLLSNPVGGDTRSILKTIGEGKINIGKNVGISNSAIISESEISIGDNTLIGGSCQILDTDFHSIDAEKRRNDEGTISKPIHIGNNVFIGTKCIILKGVTIGDNSVIGAGSVVSKDVPTNEVWAGNPARKIKNL